MNLPNMRKITKRNRYIERKIMALEALSICNSIRSGGPVIITFISASGMNALKKSTFKEPVFPSGYLAFHLT